MVVSKPRNGGTAERETAKRVFFLKTDFSKLLSDFKSYLSRFFPKRYPHLASLVRYKWKGK